MYKDCTAVQLPLPHSDSVPVPRRPSLTEEYIMPSIETEAVPVSMYEPSNVTAPCNHIEASQERLSLMVRQLNLSQRKAEILAQHLKCLNILGLNVKVTSFRKRQQVFLPFFELSSNNSFSYCKDIRGLMSTMRIKYDPEQ